jgi:hypothetical protein
MAGLPEMLVPIYRIKHFHIPEYSNFKPLQFFLKISIIIPNPSPKDARINTGEILGPHSDGYEDLRAIPRNVTLPCSG